MMFDDDDRNDKKDFFDDDNVEIKKPKPEKKPTYKPDDPAYWEEESDWEHLRPRSRTTFRLWIIAALVLLGIIIAAWLRYFSPYVEDAIQYGYIDHIEKRGTVIKTFEGVLFPYRELMDSTRIYDRDFVFSVADDKTAAKLYQIEKTHKPVRVVYKKYHATVPWRGASKIVVTDVDTVNKDEILPPEFAPGKR